MEQLDLFGWSAQQPRRGRAAASEWRIVSLRETAPEELSLCDTPAKAVDYWERYVARGPVFNPDCECLAVLLLNTRARIRAHHIVSIGSLAEAMAYPREVFRAAVIAAAYSIVLMHNHPSGDPALSDSDLRITRRMAEVGGILGIALVDHIIVGHRRHFSLREAGIL